MFVKLEVKESFEGRIPNSRVVEFYASLLQNVEAQTEQLKNTWNVYKGGLQYFVVIFLTCIQKQHQ